MLLDPENLKFNAAGSAVTKGYGFAASCERVDTVYVTSVLLEGHRTPQLDVESKMSVSHDYPCIYS
jgi:hypothetical protein